jgi:hypothetical protein
MLNLVSNRVSGFNSLFNTMSSVESIDQKEIQSNLALAEGFNIYVLKKSLEQQDINFKIKMKKWRQETIEENDNVPRQWQKSMLGAFKHFRGGVAMIEIVTQADELQKIYFRLPKITKYMSFKSKEKLLNGFPRENPNDKINGLLESEQVALDEMNHFMYLRSKGIKSPYYYFSSLRNLNLLVAVVLGLLIMFTNENSDKSALRALGTIQLVTSCLTWIAWAIFQMPLDLKRVLRLYEAEEKANRKPDSNNILSFYSNKKNQPLVVQTVLKYLSILYSFSMSSFFVILTLNMLFSVLGIAVSRVFFTFILLDIIDRSPILRNVVKSVSLNYVQLLMTFLLGAVIIYIYSMIGYYTNIARGIFINLTLSFIYSFTSII